MAPGGFDVFGTSLRSKVLLAIYVLEETHSSELSRILGSGITTIRNAIDTLERAGIVGSVLIGKTRRVSLDPRFRAYDELKALLNKLSLGDPALLHAIADVRRRPRRPGKKL